MLSAEGYPTLNLNRTKIFRVCVCVCVYAHMHICHGT